MGFVFQLQKTLSGPLSSHNPLVSRRNIQGCWAGAGADPGGENSEFTSFVLGSSRARVRAELWVLSQECPLGAGIGVATEQLCS